MTGLSFEALTSIDFVSLLRQRPSSTLSAAVEDDREPALIVSNTLLASPPDGPVACSFHAPFYSIGETTVWLHVSLTTMKRLLFKGALPFVRVSARRKIPLSALRAYVICSYARRVLPSASPSSKSIGYDWYSTDLKNIGRLLTSRLSIHAPA